MRRMLLTARDVELLRAVHRHRLLRSTHLISLAGGSRQGVLRRLQRLFHHGYLDRPAVQLDWYARGSEPFVYGLGKRGAKVFATAGEVHRDQTRWDTKNRNLSRVFLHHALAVADVMVAFEVACREREGVDFIRREDVLASAPKETRRLRLPFRWYVDVPLNGRRERLGVQPDRVFGLRFNERGVSSAYFFLEADRGTMPVSRRDLAQTSFVRKLLAYRETWRQGVHRKHFNIPSFRVLTVTANSARLAHLVAASRSIATGGAGLFLFATASQLDDGNVLTMPWVDGRGELVNPLSAPDQRLAVRPAARPSTATPHQGSSRKPHIRSLRERGTPEGR